jgi:hypothetical protein
MVETICESDVQQDIHKESDKITHSNTSLSLPLHERKLRNY